MLPISEQHKQTEMDTVLQIAKDSGYPQHLISKLSLDFTNKTHHKQYGNPKTKKTRTCICGWLMLKFSNRFAILGLILIDKANYIKERMGIMEECIFLMAGFKCLELQHGIWTSDVSGDEKSAV